MLCRNTDNPDLWFPESVEHNATPNKTYQRRVSVMIQNSRQAIAICNQCPAKAPCLAEGMREENIEHGIWGGTMAGDRIIMAGITELDQTKRAMIRLAEKVRALEV